MNKLKLDQTGGFPMDADTLNQMQNAYSILNSLGEVFGNFSILKGCETVGAYANPGVIYLNGEVIEFRGGIITPNVAVVEEPQTGIFENQSIKEIHYTRYVSFSGAVTGYPWANFKRRGFADKSGTVVVEGVDGLDLAVGRIKFPAIQNPSSDPNTLDDYEEGTWTPVIQGSITTGTCVITNRVARYNKIGGQVTLHFRIDYASFNGTGALTITGIPFVSSSDTGSYVGVVSTDSILYPSGLTNAILRLEGSSNKITCLASASGKNWIAVSSNSNGAILGSLTYQSN